MFQQPPVGQSESERFGVESRMTDDHRRRRKRVLMLFLFCSYFFSSCTSFNMFFTFRCFLLRFGFFFSFHSRLIIVIARRVVIVSPLLSLFLLSFFLCTYKNGWLMLFKFNVKRVQGMSANVWMCCALHRAMMT